MKRKTFTCMLSVILFVFLFVHISDLHAGAASSGEIREQINEMERQQETLHKQMLELEEKLSDNLSDISETVNQKEYIDLQIILIQDQLSLTDEQISAYNLMIADKQDELDEAQLAFKTLHDTHKHRIRAMEEAGKLSYWSVLFQANSFFELLDRMNLIQEIAESDYRRLRELNNAAEEVQLLQKELTEQKDSLVLVRQEQEETRKLLAEKQNEAQTLLQQLIAQGEAFEILLQQSEERQQQLMNEIAQLEIEYDQAAYQEWLATYIPPTTVPPPTTEPPTTVPPVTETESIEETTEPTEETQADESTQPTETESTEAPPKDKFWVTPVSGYVLTSPFGMRFHPMLNIWRMHNGVDLCCAEGTPIYATREGVVSVAAYQADGAGNYVQIDHRDGYKSIYMHMTHYIVAPGEFVSAGQCIGYVGSTGLSETNHLHFGISYDGAYVNPMEYIS